VSVRRQSLLEAFQLEVPNGSLTFFQFRHRQDHVYNCYSMQAIFKGVEKLSEKVFPLHPPLIDLPHLRQSRFFA
jgi:hypothetical protein